MDGSNGMLNCENGEKALREFFILEFHFMETYFSNLFLKGFLLLFVVSFRQRSGNCDTTR